MPDRKKTALTSLDLCNINKIQNTLPDFYIHQHLHLGNVTVVTSLSKHTLKFYLRLTDISGLEIFGRRA